MVNLGHCCPFRDFTMSFPLISMQFKKSVHICKKKKLWYSIFGLNFFYWSSLCEFIILAPLSSIVLIELTIVLLVPTVKLLLWKDYIIGYFNLLCFYLLLSIYFSLSLLSVFVLTILYICPYNYFSG